MPAAPFQLSSKFDDFSYRGLSRFQRGKDTDISGTLTVTCAVTGKMATWNGACDAGWITVYGPSSGDWLLRLSPEGYARLGIDPCNVRLHAFRPLHT